MQRSRHNGTGTVPSPEKHFRQGNANRKLLNSYTFNETPYRADIKKTNIFYGCVKFAREFVDAKLPPPCEIRRTC